MFGFKPGEFGDIFAMSITAAFMVNILGWTIYALIMWLVG